MNNIRSDICVEKLNGAFERTYNVLLFSVLFMKKDLRLIKIHWCKGWYFDPPEAKMQSHYFHRGENAESLFSSKFPKLNSTHSANILGLLNVPSGI